MESTSPSARPHTYRHPVRLLGWLAVGALLTHPVTATALEGWALRNDTSWYTTGNVVVVDVGTGDATTVVSGGGCFGYCFSPDGTRIAFWRGGTIFTVALDGSDLFEVCDTYSTSYREQYLSWTTSNHIYWSERSPYIYRCDVETGVRETVHTSTNGDIRLAKVSLDGRRAGCTRNEVGWRAWAIDLESHEERDLGDGCQATSSPDGILLTHNIPGHQTANIHRFSDLSVYTVLHKPPARGEFDMHEFSHSSNRHIVYTCDVDYAYVHDIETDTPTYVGRGAPFDFRPATLEAHLALDQATVSFAAIEAGSNPVAQDVALLNLGGGTLPAVSLSSPAAWLTVTPSGTGNAQVLANLVAIDGLTAGSYATGVTVTCDNTAGSPATYAVELDIAPAVVNAAPQVSAGSDQTENLGTAVWLDGTATDDGLPAEDLQVVWSQESGPGTATFTSPGSIDTEVQFDRAGAYRLRLTADDGELSAWDEAVITMVDVSVPSLTISSPAGGEAWAVGTTQIIRWVAFDVSAISLEYSTDGGATLAATIVDAMDTGDPSWGSLAWTVPDTPSADCVILAADTSGAVTTQSNVFEIVAPTVNLAPVVDAGPDASIELGFTAWTSGTVTDDGLPTGELQLTWSQQSGPGVAIFASPSAASTEVQFDQAGVFELLLTADDGELTASDSVLITVVEVGEPLITILSPAGGETWEVGSTQVIRWSAANLTDIALRYSTDGGTTVAGLITDSIATDDPGWSALSWTVPDTPSTNCVIMAAGYFYEAPTQSNLFEIRTPANEPSSGTSSPAGVVGGCSCHGASRGAWWSWAMAWALVGSWRRRLGGE